MCFIKKKIYPHGLLSEIKDLLLLLLKTRFYYVEVTSILKLIGVSSLLTICCKSPIRGA